MKSLSLSGNSVTITSGLQSNYNSYDQFSRTLRSEVIDRMVSLLDPCDLSLNSHHCAISGYGSFLSIPSKFTRSDHPVITPWLVATTTYEVSFSNLRFSLHRVKILGDFKFILK
jgi:hypothetical protein